MALQGQVRDPQAQLCDPEDAASAGAAYSIIGLQGGAPGWSLPRDRGCVLGGEHVGGQVRQPWGKSHILIQKPASAKRKGFWLLVFSSKYLGKRKENLALRSGPRMVVPHPKSCLPFEGGLPSLVSCQGWRALVQGPGGPGGRVGETVHPCVVSGNCTSHPTSPAVLSCYRS